MRFEEFVCAHHWKVLSSIVVLSLFCFGLKAVTVDTNFDKLWIEGKSCYVTWFIGDFTLCTVFNAWQVIEQLICLLIFGSVSTV